MYDFPYAIKEFPRELIPIGERLRKNQDFVKLDGTRIVCHARVKEFGRILYNFKPRPTDVWLIGYPRSGTTLAQEILYLLGTDLDYARASAQLMKDRFPVIEGPIIYEDNSKWSESAVDKLEKMDGIRFIRSHFGFKLLHPEILEIGCKVVYIARNPKDVVNSMAHFPDLKKIPGYEIKHLWDLLKYDIDGFGNYFEMLEEAWKRRSNPNLLVLFYEDLITDKAGSVLKIADFLGKTLTGHQLRRLLDHIDIEKFRNNASLNNDQFVDRGLYEKTNDYAFIRKGRIGDWRNDMPEELIPEIDEWVERNFEAMPDFQIPEIWVKAMK